MYISYNKYQRYGKIVFITFFILIGWALIWVIVFRRPPTLQIDTYLILILLIILLGTAFMLIQLIFLPSGVEINTDNKSLNVHYFLIKPKKISSEDILNYSSTIIYTKSTAYEGVLVHTKSGGKYLFDDFNLADYKPIKEFLEACHINFAGNEKFRNISYFIAFFRHH